MTVSPGLEGRPALAGGAPTRHAPAEMDEQNVKQRCPLAFVVLAWTLYPAGALFLLVVGQYPVLVAWVVGAPLTMWAYVRWFPSISRYLGYGTVADRSARPPVHAPVVVTLYTAVGCPFCPILRRRLRGLQPAVGFELREVNVTARPDILVRKGAWSVPVVEVGDRLLIGNATSDQLVDLMVGAAAQPAPLAPERSSLPG